MSIATHAKKRSLVKIKAKSEIFDGKLVLELPLKTKSEANCFEHWRIKHARHKNQQRAVALALKPFRSKIKLPCQIMLTRIAPRALDRFDNLPMSFKYIVDAICAIITGNYLPGQADNNEKITINCDQIPSKYYGIRIELSW